MEMAKLGGAKKLAPVGDAVNGALYCSGEDMSGRCVGAIQFLQLHVMHVLQTNLIGPFDHDL